VTFRRHLKPSSELKLESESTLLCKVSFRWKWAGSRRRRLS